MTRRLQDEDGFIMIEFGNAVRHWIDTPAKDIPKDEFKAITKPFMKRLAANGHDPSTVNDLLLGVFLGDRNAHRAAKTKG